MFKAMRGVVPVKFTLLLNGAATCQLPAATIALTTIGGSTAAGVDPTVYMLPSDSGSSFRIDASSCQYVYNLDAKSLAAATYEVDISITGSVVGRATFVLQ